jgi:hypothetical protein
VRFNEASDAFRRIECDVFAFAQARTELAVVHGLAAKSRLGDLRLATKSLYLAQQAFGCAAHAPLAFPATESFLFVAREDTPVEGEMQVFLPNFVAYSDSGQNPIRVSGAVAPWQRLRARQPRQIRGAALRPLLSLPPSEMER